jgi:hypothetical protein
MADIVHVTIVPRGGTAAAGAWAMIIISILLFVTALIIGWDGYKAYQRYGTSARAKKAPAAADD